jgi:hypothetical protein
MLRHYEAGWRYNGVTADPSPEELILLEKCWKRQDRRGISFVTTALAIPV